MRRKRKDLYRKERRRVRERTEKCIRFYKNLANEAVDYFKRRDYYLERIRYWESQLKRR